MNSQLALSVLWFSEWMTNWLIVYPKVCSIDLSYQMSGLFFDILTLLPSTNVSDCCCKLRQPLTSATADISDCSSISSALFCKNSWHHQNCFKCGNKEYCQKTIAWSWSQILTIAGVLKVRSDKCCQLPALSQCLKVAYQRQTPGQLILNWKFWTIQMRCIFVGMHACIFVYFGWGVSNVCTSTNTANTQLKTPVRMLYLRALAIVLYAKCMPVNLNNYLCAFTCTYLHGCVRVSVQTHLMENAILYLIFEILFNNLWFCLIVCFISLLIIAHVRVCQGK